MLQDSTPAPVRGALFYTAKLLLLMTVGATIQHAISGFGSALNQLLFSLGLALVFTIYGDMRPVREVFRLRPLSARAAALTLATGVATVALIQVLGAVLTLLVQRSGGQMLQYYNLSNTPFWMALLLLGILPPLCEELAYRGFLQTSLAPLGPRAGVLLTALLFGVMHGSLIRLLPLALLGWIFGMAVQRTGSILASMIMHFVNNATALGLAYYGSGIPSIEQVGLPRLLGLSVALGAVVWFLLRTLGTVRPTAATEEAAAAPRLVIRGMTFVLLPALLIYAYAAASELAAVFGR